MNDIEEHPEYVWDYHWISENPNLTEDFISKYCDEDWDLSAISKNPNISEATLQ